jgi:hypothetical protein
MPTPPTLCNAARQGAAAKAHFKRSLQKLSTGHDSFRVVQQQNDGMPCVGEVSAIAWGNTRFSRQRMRNELKQYNRVHDPCPA